MRYTETSKKVKNAIIGLAIYFLILVVIDIAAQVYAFQNQTNQLAIIIATGLNQGITPILLLFIGAMIAMITGYFSSISTIELESAKERQNLIIGFFYEVEELQEKLKPIPTGNSMECYRYLIGNKIKIYSKDGLFFVLRKEVFELDTPLLEKILDVYSKINLVDDLLFDTTITYRHGIIASAMSPNADFVKIPKYISDIKLQIDELFVMLDSEKKKNEH